MKNAGIKPAFFFPRETQLTVESLPALIAR